MTTSSALSLSFAFAVLLASSSGGKDGFHYEIAPAEIRPGERATLTLTIPETLTEENPPVVKDELLTQHKQILILEKELTPARDHFTLKLQFTTHSAGVFTLPPIEVRVGANSYSTELKEFKAVSDRADGDSELRPEYEEVGYPIPWKRYLLFFVLAYAFFEGIRWAVRRLPTLPRRPARPSPVPAEDPLIWLRRELDRFFAALSPEDCLPSRKADELFTIMRHYFARVTQSPVEAWTLSEFQSRLRKDPAAQEIARRMSEWEWLRFKRFSQEKTVPLDHVAHEIERILFA